jgi:hypothetical protein
MNEGRRAEDMHDSVAYQRVVEENDEFRSRIEELEKQNKHLREGKQNCEICRKFRAFHFICWGCYRKIRHNNATAQEILSFYADKATYLRAGFEATSPIEDDRGERATKALEKIRSGE